MSVDEYVERNQGDAAIRGKSDYRRDRRRETIRINQWIKEKEVRLIDQHGVHIGVVPIAKALAMSQQADLDLVEVGSKSVPVVCRIMDFGQYKYEQAKKQREARKKQRQIAIKEIKFRPRIEKHDYEFKLRHARRFLEHGDKVKFVVQFRGRELAHREFGNAVLNRLVEDLADCGQVESPAKQEGRYLTMVMAALPAARRKKVEETKQDQKDEPEPERAPQKTAAS